MVNVLVTLKENRAMVDWSIDEDMVEKILEVESRIERNPQKQQVLVLLRNVTL
jgi:hypothetical protein